ncbi:MFS transporter [Sneathiella chinensis]|uniref:MFS transporter n=1 Tax=Sneathiella chinensis TaxID=349750 RepID=A0ABQ5U1B7_9PROT|nr:MFS transporter [Sneathiella chinensis]GLQ05476.1 MFS transporter [Sneathiella chinensis]
MLSISIVVICFVLSLITRMAPEHFPNLVSPLIDEFSWSRSSVTSIYSVCALSTGLSGPIAGFLFDRLGPRNIFTIGLLSGGSGLVLAGYSNNLWSFYIGLGVMVGFATACCGNVPTSALVSRWFKTKLPLAMSVVFSSLGAGSFAGLFGSQLLISTFGWRQAEIILGCFLLAMIPILLALPWKTLAAGSRLHVESRAAEMNASRPRNTLSSAIRTTNFWGLFLVFFVTANGIYSIMIQSVTYLIDHQLTPVDASLHVGLTGLFIPIGMITCGYLLTRYRVSVVAIGTFVTTISGALFLWSFDDPGEIWKLYLFVALFGLTMGTRAPINGSVAARFFAGPNFGSIYGFIYIGGGLGTATGSFLSGWIFDTTGSYSAVFLFSLTCLISGALPFLLVKDIRTIR